MSQPNARKVVILGGGLGGAAAAYLLAGAGYRDVTVVESGPRIGGLAGSFEQDGRSYPLGYHHILHRDRTLLFFLDRLGILPRVKWRRIKMLFERAAALYDLAQPLDFLRFPMPFVDKLRFARLMIGAAITGSVVAKQHGDAAALLDRHASPAVREILFEPLTRLKFQLPCREVSAEWLLERLRYREGSSPLGYVPDTNWTTLLCDGVARLLDEVGARLLLRKRVVGLRVEGDTMREAQLDDGTRLAGDLFISALPLEVYRDLAPADQTPAVRAIRYTALISAVCGTQRPSRSDFYWLNLASLAHQAGGLFVLSALNPTIGAPGETILNFVTHLRRDQPLFRASDDELMRGYAADHQRLFGAPLAATWTRITRVPYYSPIFDAAYENPPLRSTSLANVLFTGTCRTHPSVASTGTALHSGLVTATAMLAPDGGGSSLLRDAEAFRPRR